MILEADKNDHLLYEVDAATGKLVGDPVCEECSVCQRVANLLSGTITLWIELWVRGTRKSFKMDRNKLFNGGFKDDLTDQGLTLPSNEPDVVAAIRDHLIESDIGADEVWTHDRLGFHEIDIGKNEKKLVFLTDEVIGFADRDSHYHKPEVTAPKGTLSSWREFINQEVIGHPYLELALAISMSAPIVHIFRMKGVYAENPIWALIGKSSSGKTSVLRIMASVYTSPAEGRGLIGDFNGTENALYAKLASNIGLPHLIDEATIKSDWDFAPLIYNFSKGENRARCDSKGTLQKRVQFSGPIVISGERNLFGQSSADGGVLARMIGLNNIQWTTDANHADRILLKSHQNYGTAIKPLAKMLMNILDRDSDILEKKFYKELGSFRMNLPDVSGEEQRLLKMYSTVIIAAQVANKAVKINLNVDNLRESLLQLHQTAATERDIAQELYDTVMDKAGHYGSYFPKTGGKNKNFVIPATLWGEYTTRNKREVLWISGIKFREFAGKRFANPTPYLNELYQQGLVEKFSDGFTTKHRLGNSNVRCYCFYK